MTVVYHDISINFLEHDLFCRFQATWWNRYVVHFQLSASLCKLISFFLVWLLVYTCSGLRAVADDTSDLIKGHFLTSGNISFCTLIHCAMPSCVIVSHPVCTPPPKVCFLSMWLVWFGFCLGQSSCLDKKLFLASEMLMMQDAGASSLLSCVEMLALTHTLSVCK